MLKTLKIIWHKVVVLFKNVFKANDNFVKDLNDVKMAFGTLCKEIKDVIDYIKEK